MYSEEYSKNFDDSKSSNRSSSSTSPIRCQTRTPHAVSNLLNLDPQYPSPTALMAALTASLYRETSIESNQNDTPPLSSSSSSSLNSTPKKKGLSDVINKLHKAASNQTTPNKTNDSDQTENDDTESQINDQVQLDVKITNKSQQKLFDLLQRANLIQYFGSFIEQGGDDLDQLCDANETEFKEICDLVGMSSKPLHVKRLKKSLDELKASKNTNESGQKSHSHSIEKFLPEQNISLNLPTPHSSSSSSSSSSTSSSSSFTISKLFRSESPTQQGLLTTGQSYLYQMLNSKQEQEKKDQSESEDEENFEDYADTDDVEDEEDEEINDEQKILPQSSSIKIEQNEKMLKKNKVIELYTKGERCVRKLSQLTGVPLTTVYRVIGKLKGINYNIPRGNGAGRKTILDAQDREILVEILNKQPRISRKALGKELEKLTGKSIHNSTLNRELCRLRYQNNGQQQQIDCVKISKKHKKFDELNDECLKMIQSESKRYGSLMSQSEFECKPLSITLSPNLSKQIIEICQMSTNLSQNSSQQLQQLKLDKIKQSLNELFELSDGFYDKCLYESCVQLCLQKPTLLTRHDDLLNYAKKILESLQIYDDLKSKLKRNASTNLEQVPKKSKVEDPQPQSQIQTPFNLYTAALALHLQQGQTFDLNSYLAKIRMNLYQNQQESLRTLMEKNDIELRANLKKQDELRLKLFGLSMSNVNNEQIRSIYENLQLQLAELLKRHAQLLSEQARLKSQDISSQQSDMRKSNDDTISQDVNENIDVLK